MSDDNFDDGLVHEHGWCGSHPPANGTTMSRFPIADTTGARIPSTAVHDDHLFRD